MTPDVAGLAARVDALEAEREVMRTLNQYGHAIGVGDEDGWIDCFVPEGVFDVRRRAAGGIFQPIHPHQDVRAGGAKPSITYRGHKELRRFISQHPRPPARYHKHIVVDAVVTIERDTAAVTSFFVRLDAGPDGHPHLTAFGRYIDAMVRCADGRWRFTQRAAEVESRGPDPA